MTVKGRGLWAMCDHGTMVPLLVPIRGDLSHSGEFEWKTKPVDVCIAPIVEALNKAGIHTLSSCCGHGESVGEIPLMDGRSIVVRPHPLAFGLVLVMPSACVCASDEGCEGEMYDPNDARTCSYCLDLPDGIPCPADPSDEAAWMRAGYKVSVPPRSAQHARADAVTAHNTASVGLPVTLEVEYRVEQRFKPNGTWQLLDPISDQFWVPGYERPAYAIRRLADWRNLTMNRDARNIDPQDIRLSYRQVSTWVVVP